MKRFTQILAVSILLTGLGACNKNCPRKECAPEPAPIEKVEQMKKELNHK